LQRHYRASENQGGAISHAIDQAVNK
jgi:hypothetical protein